MDKLEKALKKARELRGYNLGYGEATRGYTKSKNIKRSDVILPQSHNAIEISEQNLDRYRILAHRTRNKKADIFRMLRAQVMQLMAKSGFKTLAITSPNHGDGKTTIALNLAMSMALDLKHTVLLADMDLRKPGVTTYLGINSSFGLTDHLINDKPVKDCLVRTSFERLCVLPAGIAMDNSSEILGSSKMIALARDLKTRYDDRIVIYDMPPLMTQDDSIAFLPNIDAVLMVVNEGITRVEDVKKAMNVLSGANVIGVVMNNAGKRKIRGGNNLL